jgi:hypothetical protein
MILYQSKDLHSVEINQNAPSIYTSKQTTTSYNDYHAAKYLRNINTNSALKQKELAKLVPVAAVYATHMRSEPKHLRRGG